LNGAGTKRLILKYYKVLSNFAFKFNLRRCTKVPELSRPQMAERARKDLPGIEAAKFPIDAKTGSPKYLEAGAYNRPLLSST